VKKVIFICMLALLTLSCTESIEKNTQADLDETAAMVLTQHNLPDNLHLRACIVLEDRVVVLPKEKGEKPIVIKNYDATLIVCLTVLFTLIGILLIIGILIASYRE
jgi:hypothetical protein